MNGLLPLHIHYLVFVGHRWALISAKVENKKSIEDVQKMAKFRGGYIGGVAGNFSFEYSKPIKRAIVLKVEILILKRK